MTDFQTIAAIRFAAALEPAQAVLGAQIESSLQKTTRDGKPYRELALVDATGRMTLRVWSDHPSFRDVEEMDAGRFVCVEGEFSVSGAFGLEAKRWALRQLTEIETALLLEGPAELRERQAADYDFIVSEVSNLSEPRLRLLAETFLRDYGERFRRTAAARTYHHARRGGLVEHTAQMMRSALALCPVYPELNKSLLVAGVLFHDVGKLWENAIEERGFSMPHTERGELLGHIPIGIELVNNLWRQIATPEQIVSWNGLQPASEDVRLHLLHLIASHHGGLEFGSPVVPKTPEAWALHYVDNLDARMEMLREGYKTSAAVAPRIFERMRPLPGNLVMPLPSTPEESASDA